MHPNTSINTIPIEKGKGGATRSHDATALKYYGEMYSQALDETEAEYSTLSNYKWVVSRIPFSLRRENLTYSIHKEIANTRKGELMGLPALPDNIEFTETGLAIPADLPFDEWLTLGETLKQIDKAIQWWVGDWLNAGERNYGEMYAQALDETEYSYSTLRDYKWVATSIELSLRNENVPFWVHRTIAPLPPDRQAFAIRQAAAEKWTVREAKSKVRQLQYMGGKSEPLPKDKYRIIYADPPWKYGDTRDGVKGYSAAVDHYPAMTIHELCSLPVENLAESNAVLFLWVTSPMLEECFPVIRAWSFEYKASFIWDKVGHNVGHYNSVRHELLLICTRGSCLPDVTKLYDSVQEIKKTKEHSKKPEEFRNIIDTIYAVGPRIELFRRGGAIDGWVMWGNEAIAI